MVLDAQRLRWKSTSLQMNGRPGQKQNGVDIWGPDDLGRRAGIQCKRHKDPLSLKDIETEIGNAEAFTPALTTLYVATTNEHDAMLQQQVRLLSDVRVAAGKFAVTMLFWDDVVSGLALNPQVFKLHYPTIQLATMQAVDRDRLLAAVELGYYGPFLWDYILLTFGEIGQMANADPEDVPAVARIIEQRSQQLLPPADGDYVLKTLAEIMAIVADPERHTEADWATAEAYCKRIATRLISLIIPVSESNFLETGRSLGNIYHHMDEAVPESTSQEIRRRLLAILPTDSHPMVEARIASADTAKYRYGYNWASTIYTCLEREIRFAQFD